MHGCVVPTVVNSAEKKEYTTEQPVCFVKNVYQTASVIQDQCEFQANFFKYRNAHVSAYRWVLAVRNDNKNTRKCIQQASFHKILCF
jgi:hypothetical protein